MFSFYKPIYNPSGLSGLVGGSTYTYELSGYLNELFVHVDAPPSGTTEHVQYRKIIIVNDYESVSTYTRVWLDELEYDTQISISLETSGSNTTESPLTAPSGISTWYTPSNYTEGLDIGTMQVNGTTGLWIKQTLTGIIEDEPYASFRICVGGIIG